MYRMICNNNLIYPKLNTVTARVKQWLNRKTEAAAASVVTWLLSKPAARRKFEEVVLDQFGEFRPDVDDIRGLERLVEDMVENATSNISVDSIDGFERAVEKTVEEVLDEHKLEVNADDVNGLDEFFESMLAHGEVVEDLTDRVGNVLAGRLLHRP